MSLIAFNNLEKAWLRVSQATEFAQPSLNLEDAKFCSTNSPDFAKGLRNLWPEAHQGAFAHAWKNLACERNPELFSQELLGLASELEDQDLVVQALKVYRYLGENELFPQIVRDQAQAQLSLWKGQGSLGSRASHWLRFLPQEISRGETATGLILGAGGFNLGLRLGNRLLIGASSLLRALGASAMGLVGEASAMSLGYGAVQTWHGESSELAGLWSHSLAMSSAYRGMGFLMGRLSHLPLPRVWTQAWHRSSSLLQQELGKFSGILGVETLMQGFALNLGGYSTGQDIWFNSVTTYFNLALYHSLFKNVAPSRGRPHKLELSLSQYIRPFLPRTRPYFSTQPRWQLASGLAFEAPSKGPVLSLAQGERFGRGTNEKDLAAPVGRRANGRQEAQEGLRPGPVKLGGWQGLRMVLKNINAPIRQEILQGKPVVFELLTGHSELDLKFAKASALKVLNDIVRSADPRIQREISITFSEAPEINIKWTSPKGSINFQDS